MEDTSSLARVRRTQRAISRDFLLRDLAQYPIRDDFQRAAERVVNHYFRMAVANSNTENVKDLIEVYSHAFVLAPLLYRLPGAYRPDWGLGTVLSWFRRCITEDTRQFYFSQVAVDVEPDVDVAAGNMTELLKIRDPLFTSTAAALLANLCASGGRKAEAAKLYLDPILGAHVDADLNDRFSVRATGVTRRKIRAKGEPVASYLRRGSVGVLLADKQTASSTHAQVKWQDIREVPLRWGDYVIEWVKKEDHLRVSLDDRVIAASLREVKAAVDAVKTPQQKYSVAVRIATRFLEYHRYATGSLAALQAYEKDVERVIRKRVTATVPTLVYVAKNARTYYSLVLPITNPFLITDPHELSYETWMSFWSPYR
jgi:hypothetical protein